MGLFSRLLGKEDGPRKEIPCYECDKEISDKALACPHCGAPKDAHAQYNTGLMYAAGFGVPEDVVEAARWYRLAAEEGHGGAQNSLGLMYAFGRGVPQDVVEAVRWLRLASEQGNAEAQYNLGDMYRDGQGAPEDHAEAARWYRLAAEQRSPMAWTRLGDMYRDGQGVPQDDVLACMWWNIDADDEAAQQNKALLEERMTREQIAEAQRLSTEWLEAHPPSGN